MIIVDRNSRRLMTLNIIVRDIDEGYVQCFFEFPEHGMGGNGDFIMFSVAIDVRVTDINKCLKTVTRRKEHRTLASGRVAPGGDFGCGFFNA